MGDTAERGFRKFPIVAALGVITWLIAGQDEEESIQMPAGWETWTCGGSNAPPYDKGEWYRRSGGTIPFGNCFNRQALGTVANGWDPHADPVLPQITPSLRTQSVIRHYINNPPPTGRGNYVQVWNWPHGNTSPLYSPLVFSPAKKTNPVPAPNQWPDSFPPPNFAPGPVQAPTPVQFPERGPPPSSPIQPIPIGEPGRGRIMPITREPGRRPVIIHDPGYVPRLKYERPRDEPPKKGDKEKKFKVAMHPGLGLFFGTLTESMDFVSALYKAVPWCARPVGFVGPMKMAQTIYDNLDMVDWRQAFSNLAANQVEDALIGAFENRLNQFSETTGLGIGWGTAIRRAHHEETAPGTNYTGGAESLARGAVEAAMEGYTPPKCSKAQNAAKWEEINSVSRSKPYQTRINARRKRLQESLGDYGLLKNVDDVPVHLRSDWYAARRVEKLKKLHDFARTDSYHPDQRMLIDLGDNALRPIDKWPRPMQAKYAGQYRRFMAKYLEKGK